METQKVRKKPVEVDAVQWDGTPQHVTKIINWIHSYNGDATYWCEPNESKTCSGFLSEHKIRIQTLEGVMYAEKGSFVIKGVEDEFYPIREDIFYKTYDIL